MPYSNYKDANQPAHLLSLISAFVRCLDSIISILPKFKVSRLKLASVAGQAGMSHTWLQTPEDRFSRDAAHLYYHENRKNLDI